MRTGNSLLGAGPVLPGTAVVAVAVLEPPASGMLRYRATGTIPDVTEAVDGPRIVSADGARAREVLRLVPLALPDGRPASSSPPARRGAVLVEEHRGQLGPAADPEFAEHRLHMVANRVR